MEYPRIRIAVFILSCMFLASCSRSPESLLTKHVKRGDEYAAKGKFQEAVIEYRNAAKAVPTDADAHWKLAKAAIEVKDIRTAYQELQRTVELAPGNFEAWGTLGEIYIATGKTEEGTEIAEKLVRDRPGDPKGYLLKSGLAIRAGKREQAIAMLKQAAERDPKRVKTLLAIGNLYLVNRDRKSALEWYDKALNVDPDSAEVHVVRGNYFFASGDPGKGEETYRKAIGLAKDKEAIRIALAEHYLYMGRLDDSEKELNAVIKELNSQRARKLLAEIRLETGKVGEAKAIVDDILEENAKDLDGKFLKGRIALAENRTDDAMVLFSDVIKQDATMAGAHLYNGLAEIRKGQLEAGRKGIREAVRLEPGNARAQLILGQVSLQSRDAEGAEKAANEVLHRNPSNGMAALLLADAYLLRKDWMKAEQIYQAISQQMSKSSLGPMKMGISRKLQGKPGDAAGFFAQALERSPADIAAINEYIFALIAAKDARRAGKTLEDALAEEPGKAPLLEIFGRYLVATGKPSEGEAAFLKAIGLSPDFIPPYYQLAMLYAKERKYPQAEERIRKVIDKDPKNIGARLLLGVILNSQGKIVEANQEYRNVLDLSPKNALAANNLAMNLADGGGNLDEALKFAQTAREAAPEDPNVADTLGWVYFRKGLIDSAIPLLSEAARNAKDSALIRYHYGMTLAKTERKKEAEGELRAALSLDSNFAGAVEARKTLETVKQP